MDLATGFGGSHETKSLCRTSAIHDGSGGHEFDNGGSRTLVTNVGQPPLVTQRANANRPRSVSGDWS